MQHARRTSSAPHHLFNLDLPQLGLGPDDHHVRMIRMGNPTATHAGATSIQRRAIGRSLRRFLTIERLCQRQPHRFQLRQIRAGEQIRVPQPPPLQAPLQQGHYVFLS